MKLNIPSNHFSKKAKIMWNNGPDLGVLFLTDKNIIALIRSVRDTKQKSDEAPDVCSKPEAPKSNYLAYFAQTCVPSERSRSILHAVNASLVFMCCQAFWQNNSTSAPLHLCASPEVRILRLLSLCRFLAWSSGAPDITSAWKWRQEAKLFITVSFGHQCLSHTAQLRAYCALWKQTNHTPHKTRWRTLCFTNIMNFMKYVACWVAEVEIYATVYICPFQHVYL